MSESNEIPEQVWVVGHPDIENAKVGDEVAITPVTLGPALVEESPTLLAPGEVWCDRCDWGCFGGNDEGRWASLAEHKRREHP